MGQVPVLGQILNVLNIVHTQHPLGQAKQSAAAHTGAAQIVRLCTAASVYQGGTRTQAGHDGTLQTGQIESAQTDAAEFLRYLAGQGIDGLRHVGRANAGDHHLFNIGQRQIVLIGEFTEGAVYRCNRIGGADKEGLDQLSLAARQIKSADFRGASAHVNTDNNTGTHSILPYLCKFPVYCIIFFAKIQ